jgi:hypothetical protein
MILMVVLVHVTTDHTILMMRAWVMHHAVSNGTSFHEYTDFL